MGDRCTHRRREIPLLGSKPLTTKTYLVMTTARIANGRALPRYRIAAYTTGVMLLGGTITLILKYVANVPHMEPETELLWIFHGYFFSYM